MESWTEELENKVIELYQQNEYYKQRTDLFSTDWLRAAQRPSAIGVVRRRGCPKRRNSTQLNSTSSGVELSCVAINGALHRQLHMLCQVKCGDSTNHNIWGHAPGSKQPREVEYRPVFHNLSTKKF